MIKQLLLLTLLLTSGATAAAAQGPAYPYSIALSCTPPTTGTVTGYNFYRAPYATSCGTFAKLNASPATGCSYTDTNPPQGTYCYEATSLDGTAESGPDLMPSQVQIPPPPPTNLGATLAKNANGTEDVIYTWKNPAGARDDTIYCGPTSPSAPVLKVFFPTTKVRVTSPPGTAKCAVTATGPTGESGLSNQVQVSVP
ncbi:MAG TPA: hypothetical protein VJX23_02965 [Candidatus Binataceae bacterium]|nr:hypothetical protein [Candidatus Binataceae bacterium]